MRREPAAGGSRADRPEGNFFAVGFARERANKAGAVAHAVANQIFGRQMIAQGGGVIINTCSLTSFVSFGEVTPYAASKAGVVMLIKSLACEWAKYNIRVNGIAPGVFRTALNSKALDTPGRSDAIIAHTPMGKIGNVDDLAGTAIYLASDASSFVTGQIIAVDGGFLAKGI